MVIEAVSWRWTGCGEHRNGACRFGAQTPRTRVLDVQWLSMDRLSGPARVERACMPGRSMAWVGVEWRACVRAVLAGARRLRGQAWMWAAVALCASHSAVEWQARQSQEAPRSAVSGASAQWHAVYSRADSSDTERCSAAVGCGVGRPTHQHQVKTPTIRPCMLFACFETVRTRDNRSREQTSYIGGVDPPPATPP